MRISDWSSDVCSSDLNNPAHFYRRKHLAPIHYHPHWLCSRPEKTWLHPNSLGKIIIGTRSNPRPIQIDRLIRPSGTYLTPAGYLTLCRGIPYFFKFSYREIVHKVMEIGRAHV